MKVELITETDDMVIRRMELPPGEAMFWHVDNCRRFSVVVRGSRLAIEYADSGEVVESDVPTGSADWDEPDLRVHRAINVGNNTYEEIVTFYRNSPDIEPQPEYGRPDRTSSDLPVCQSCSRPIETADEFGTELNGSRSTFYCSCCYENGVWLEPDVSMEELKQRCIDIWVDHSWAAEPEARKHFDALFPKLERWRPLS